MNLRGPSVSMLSLAISEFQKSSVSKSGQMQNLLCVEEFIYMKLKIKVNIKVSVLTLEVTPSASLRSLPSIESVRHYSAIISRSGGGGGGWGDGVQYARFLPLISANTFSL